MPGKGVEPDASIARAAPGIAHQHCPRAIAVELLLADKNIGLILKGETGNRKVVDRRCVYVSRHIHIASDTLIPDEAIVSMQLRYFRRIQAQRDVSADAAASQIGSRSHARDRARAREFLSSGEGDQIVGGLNIA